MRKVMTFMVALAFLGVLASSAMAGATVSGNVKAETLLTDKTEVDPGDDPEDGNMKFQNVKANVNVNGNVAEGVEALVELRTCDTSTVSVRQALIKLTNLIPNAVLRIGQLRVPYAGALQTVDNADNMGNPLIDGDMGYSDFLALDAGADCTMNFSDMFSAALGIFNGDSADNGKFALVAKGVAKPMEALTITGEYYTSNNTSDSAGATDDKVSAYEIIGQYQAEIASMLTVKGIFGKATNEIGKIEPSVSYMGIQGSYDINDMIWVAGRFVKSTSDDDNSVTKDDEETTEMAIGGGVNIAENTKVKVQYRSVKSECGSSESTKSQIKTEIVTAF